MIVLLFALLGICSSQDVWKISVPYTGNFGPAKKPTTFLYQFNVSQAALNWSLTNVTVFLKSSGPDWDLAATLGSTPPNVECTDGWFSRSTGATETLTFPVIPGGFYYVRACAFSDSTSRFDIQLNYATAPIKCTRVTGFFDDQFEYQNVPGNSTLPLMVGSNFFEGSRAGSVLGHQTNSIRSLVLTTPDGYYGLVYDVALKIGFSVTSDAISEVSVEDCGTLSPKRSTQIVRHPQKAQRDERLLAPVVCTFTSGNVKLSYQWSSNQTNGALQARFYSTRVVTSTSTFEGYGYIFKGGQTTFVWGTTQPYAMVVDNLARIGRTPKVLVAYHLKASPLADIEIDVINGNVTGWKCV